MDWFIFSVAKSRVSGFEYVSLGQFLCWTTEHPSSWIICLVLFCYMLLAVRLRYSLEQHAVGGRNDKFRSA
jgi:hypothetical protein